MQSSQIAVFAFSGRQSIRQLLMQLTDPESDSLVHMMCVVGDWRLHHSLQEQPRRHCIKRAEKHDKRPLCWLAHPERDCIQSQSALSEPLLQALPLVQETALLFSTNTKSVDRHMRPE